MAKRKKFKVQLVFLGEPLTKSNALKWRGRKAYVPARIVHYEKALKECARKAMKKAKRRPTKKLVKMTVKYFLGSKRVKDIQNLIKTTADALNKVVYQDDAQLHKVILEKQLDRENPRTKIVVEEMSNPKWTRG